MKTVLHDNHIAWGAKMVNFGGWTMPLYYTGVLHEHWVVRNHVGIFDVSHMGKIDVLGPDAENLLDYLSTNTLAKKPPGSATYTTWCNDLGMCVDDLIICKEADEKFFIVANAANRQNDLDHLLKYALGLNVNIIPQFTTEGILAIQGPSSIELLASIFQKAASLKPMELVATLFEGTSIVLSRTGYTGENGFEVYAPLSIILNLWEKILEKGQCFNIEPIGLGARNTLRLEMGFALYGHELNLEIAPLESTACWTIKWEKKDFLGKKHLEKLKISSLKRAQYGIVLDRGIPREGCEVWCENQAIGHVTSGTFSPSLKKPIALILVNRALDQGDFVEIKIRQNMYPGHVIKLPFLRLT